MTRQPAVYLLVLRILHADSIVMMAAAGLEVIKITSEHRFTQAHHLGNPVVGHEAAGIAALTLHLDMAGPG